MVALDEATPKDLGTLLFSINLCLRYHFGSFLVFCVHPADMKGKNGVIIGEEEQNEVCKKGELL